MLHKLFFSSKILKRRPQWKYSGQWHCLLVRTIVVRDSSWFPQPLHLLIRFDVKLALDIPNTLGTQTATSLLLKQSLKEETTKGHKKCLFPFHRARADKKNKVSSTLNLGEYLQILTFNPRL